MEKHDLEDVVYKKITISHVISLLKMYKVGCAEDKVIIRQLVNMFNDAQLNKEEVRNIIRESKNAAILLTPINEYICSEHLKTTLESINHEIIKCLSQIYTEFFDIFSKNKKIIAKDSNGNFVYESKDFSIILKDIFSNILHDKDNQLIEINEETISNMNSLLFIYNTLKPYLPESIYDASTNTVIRYADQIIKKISTTNFLQHINSDNETSIEEVCQTLSSRTLLGEDKLSKEDFKMLITKCSSVLYSSSKDKILALRDNINKYKDYLLEHTNNDEQFKEMIENNINFKTILAKSGVILAATPETQNANFYLLTGNSLKHTIDMTGYSINAITIEDYIKYGRMKVSIESEDLYNMLIKSPSIILSAFTPTRLFSIGKEFDEIFSKLFEENEINNPSRLNIKQFPIEQLVTGKNLKDLIEITPDKNKLDTNRDSRKNIIIQNIITLNRIMDGSQIFKIMQNNIKIFTLNPELLKIDIENLIQKNLDTPDNFNADVNEYVNQLIKDQTTKQTRRETNSTASASSKTAVTGLDIDNTFEVKTDYFKSPTEDLINKLDAEFLKLYSNFKYIETAIENMDLSTIRVKRSNLLKNISTIKELITYLGIIDKKLAKSYFQQLILCKNNCNEMIASCDKLLTENKKKNPIIQNGKAYHKAPGEGTLYDFIQRTKQFTTSIQDEESRSSAFNNLLEFEKSKKETIIQEHKNANIDRTNANQQLLESLPDYAAYSVAILELKKINQALSIEEESIIGDEDFVSE